MKKLIILCFLSVFSINAAQETDFDETDSQLVSKKTSSYSSEESIITNIINSIEKNISGNIEKYRTLWRFWEDHETCKDFIYNHEIWWIHKINITSALCPKPEHHMLYLNTLNAEHKAEFNRREFIRKSILISQS